MAVLHVVNRTAALRSCLGAAAADDVVLLIEDAVYAGASGDVDRTLHAVDVDVRARGIADKLSERVTVVTYAGFVELAAVNNPIVSWR